MTFEALLCIFGPRWKESVLEMPLRGQAVQIRVGKGPRQEERQESKDAGDGMSKVGKHISEEGDRGKQTMHNTIKR